MMGIVVPEKCWAYKKCNKTISGIYLVFILQLRGTMLCHSSPHLFHTETVCIFSHHTPSSQACGESNRTKHKEAQHSEILLLALLLTWLCTFICNSQNGFCEFRFGFSGKNILFRLAVHVDDSLVNCLSKWYIFPDILDPNISWCVRNFPYIFLKYSKLFSLSSNELEYNEWNSPLIIIFLQILWPTILLSSFPSLVLPQ